MCINVSLLGRPVTVAQDGTIYQITTPPILLFLFKNLKTSSKVFAYFNTQECTHSGIYIIGNVNE